MKSWPSKARHSISGSHGYYVTLAIIVLFFVTVFIHIYSTNWVTAWRDVGVSDPDWDGIFTDFRYLPKKAACLKHSMRPYGEVSACRMSYPRIWITIINGLGISVSDTYTAGCILGILFYVFAVGLFRKSSPLEGMCAGLILISPPVLFEVIRANIDGIIFIIVTTACFIGTSKNEWVKTFLAPFLILLAAFLKLYPIFALIPFWLASVSQKQRWVLILYAALFGVYCLCTYNDIMLGTRLIYNNIPDAYGVYLIPKILSYHTSYISLVISHEKLIKICLGLITFSGAYFFSNHLCKHGYRKPDILPGNEWEMLCFTTGSVIFISSYFLVGVNLHYRLIFLILCLPQIFTWSRMHDSVLKWQGIGFIALIMLAFWLSHISEMVFYINHVTNWVLCFVFIGCLFNECRPWLTIMTMYLSKRGGEARHR